MPGHEKFIRNMLCGVAGIDFVLFIVAADDGPMPQTLEHLAILDLLGVSRGAVALTKIDRVEEVRAVEVSEEIDELFADTSLAGVPVFPVAAMTGDGINGLKQHLLDAAADMPPRPVMGNFRLAIDRSFDVVGAGLVVTGTVFRGKYIQVALPEFLARKWMFVCAASTRRTPNPKPGRAGQRCALNLAGTNLDKDLIRRGDWIVAGDLPPVQRIDARLRVLGSEAGVLAHWTPVHIHLGAAETTGRVAVLGDKGIVPGEDGLVQLVLDRAIGAVHGDGANHSRPVGATDRRRRPGDRRLFTNARPCETGTHCLPAGDGRGGRRYSALGLAGKFAARSLPRPVCRRAQPGVATWKRWLSWYR